MNPLSIILRLLGGTALGILFYTGLWLTVRQLPHSRHPIALTLASFWIRMLVLLAGLIWAMRGPWAYVLFCLVGLWIGRSAVSKMVSESQRGENAHHS